MIKNLQVDKEISLKIFDDFFDYSKYLEWLNDEDVNQFLESRFQKHTLASIKNYVINTKKNGDYFFGIFFKNIYIGNVKIGNINKIHKRCELGIMIGDKNFWGKGVATRVISYLTDYIFRNLNLNIVIAGAYSLNESSIKAFIKSNYNKAGMIPNYWKFKEKTCDQVILIKEKEIKN